MAIGSKISLQLFEKLFENGEDSCVDYKIQHYFNVNGQAKSDKSKISFLKDVISFANTVRDTSAYIVIGAMEESPEKGNRAKPGTLSIPYVNSSKIAQLIQGAIRPAPIVHFHSYDYNGLNFEIIEIPIQPLIGPCYYFGKDGGDTLKYGEFYNRIESANEIIKGQQLLRLETWLDKLRTTGITQYAGLTKLDTGYWQKMKEKDASSFLINLNSNRDVISAAIVKGLTANMRLADQEKNELDKKIEEKLELAEPVRILVEIIGPPGQGKSTSLLRLGYKFHHDFQVFWVKDRNWIESIYSAEEKPAMILLDNASRFADEINYYIGRLEEKFSEGFVLIIAEQDSLRKNIDFEINQFDERYKVDIGSEKDTDLSGIWEFLYQNLANTDELKILFNKNKSHFISNSNKSLIADRLIDLFMASGDENLLKRVSGRADWHEWERLTISQSQTIKNLFSKVAWVAQYNSDYPIKFLSKSDSEIVRGLIATNENSPLVIDDDKFSLGLRHQKIAEWYFLLHPSMLSERKAYFKNYYFDEFGNEANVKLFRWLQKSTKFLSDFPEYTPERRFNILLNYHEKNSGSEQGGKCYYESIKICYGEINKDIAYKMLDDSIYPKVYSRTLKASYLMNDRRYEEAGKCFENLSGQEIIDEHIIKKQAQLSKLTAKNKYKSTDIEEIISAYQNQELSIDDFDGTNGLINFFANRSSYKALKLLNELFKADKYPVFSRPILFLKYIVDLRRRKLHQEAIACYKDLLETDVRFNLHSIQIVICDCYIETGRYAEAINLSSSIFNDNPLLLENLRVIERLIKCTHNSYSESQLIQYMEYFDLAIKSKLENLDDLSVNEIRILGRLYIGYAQISYRIGSESMLNNAREKLRQAVSIFPNNDHLRLELIASIDASERDTSKARNEIRILLAACTDQSTPDLILYKIEFLQRSKNENSLYHANILINILEKKQLYNEALLICKIKDRYNQGCHHEALGLIRSFYSNQKDERNYRNHEINNLFYYCLLRMSSHNGEALKINIKSNQKHIEALQRNKEYQGNIYFLFCYYVVDRIFDVDRELFVNLSQQIRQSTITNRRVSIAFIAEVIDFLLKTDHLRSVYNLLGFLKESDPATFQKNEYFVFVYFSCRIAGMDSYPISCSIKHIDQGGNFKFSSRIKAPIIWNENTMDRFVESFIYLGYKRRTIIYLYLLANANNYYRRQINLKILELLKEFDSFEHPHETGAIQKNDGYLWFVSPFRLKYFNDIVLNMKLKDGNSYENYVSVKERQLDLANCERIFVIDGSFSTKTGLIFPAWARKIKSEIQDILNNTQSDI